MSKLSRAVTFFERCDNPILLHELSAIVARRSKRFVAQAIAHGGEDAIPKPAEAPPTHSSANTQEARNLVEGTTDFAQLQTLARAIGQRTEALEIIASANFPTGSRIKVPKRVTFPPKGEWVTGTVTTTGTMLRVELDSGKAWQGPPSLARLAETT